MVGSGLPVVVIWPNVPLVRFVSGLANSGWLKRLKKSARICRLNRSVIAVVFDKLMSKFTREGPRREFRANVPYVARLLSATTCESDGNIDGPGVQGSGAFA